MNLLFKIPAHIALNALGLYLAGKYIDGFNIPLDFKELFIAALALTAMNFLLKPIIKMVLSPVILLTLGVGLIAINGLVLYILTIIVPTVTIADIQSLVYAALLTTGVNIIARILL